MVLRVWPAETSRPSGGEPSMGDTRAALELYLPLPLSTRGAGSERQWKISGCCCFLCTLTPLPRHLFPSLQRNTQHLALGLRLEWSVIHIFE